MTTAVFHFVAARVASKLQVAGNGLADVAAATQTRRSEHVTRRTRAADPNHEKRQKNRKRKREPNL